MQINKTKLTATIIITILMISAFTLMLNVSVQAQLASEQPVSGPLPTGVTPDNIVPITAYMSIRPTVVGLNQIFLVNLFPIPAPHANRIFKDFKITITKPSGQQQVVTMDSYIADGTAWFEWIADEIGTWTFKFDVPGQYFPAGRYVNGEIVTATSGGSNYPESAYYQGSSTREMTITVQEEIVYSWPEMQLPNDYWTRPVPYEYREWAQIAGDFPWRGPGGGALWD